MHTKFTQKAKCKFRPSFQHEADLHRVSEIEVFYRWDISHICLDIMPQLLIALAVSMVRSCDTAVATAVEAAGGTPHLLAER